MRSQLAVLSRKRKLDASLHLSVSRSILIASYILYLKDMRALEGGDTFQTLKGLILSSHLDQSVFDM
jgi:hypothetical protein